MTRANRAGQQIGRGIIDMVHLMYQNQTAMRFYESLKLTIDEEIERRERDMQRTAFLKGKLNI